MDKKSKIILIYGPTASGKSNFAVALAKKAKGSVPKLETGGVVKKTGMAEVHKGEAFSGTKNEMGFGASMKETERLLSENTAAVKQLTAKHTELMNSLTGKVGEMAMS